MKYIKRGSKYSKVSNEQLLDKLKEAATLLGGSISRNDLRRHKILKDFPKYGIYEKRFGSFGKARKLAGLPLKTGRPRNPNKKRIALRLRFEILSRDKFTCQYCGRTPQDGAKLAIDHIIPFSKGGKTISENLITSCSKCNAGKGDIILGNKKAE